MKRHLRIIILIIISLFVCTSVNADSSFSSSIEVPNDITENQFNLILGFFADENMIVMQKLKYDSRYVEFDSVTAGEYFNVTVSEPVVDGFYKTITVLADSDYAFDSYNYAQLTFNTTGKMKKGAETDIEVTNIQGVGTDKKIYTSKDSNLYLHRISEGNIEYRYKELNSSTKMELFFRKNLFVLIIAIIVIIVLIILLQLLKRVSLLKKGKTAAVSKEELMNPQVVNPTPNVQPVIPEQPVVQAQPVVQEQPEPVVQPEVQQQDPNQLFNPLEHKPEIIESQSTIQSEMTTQAIPEQPKEVQSNQDIAFGSIITQSEMEMPKTKEVQEMEIPKEKTSQDSSMASIFSGTQDNTVPSSNDSIQPTQSIDPFNTKPNDGNNIMSFIGLLVLSLSIVTYSVKADGIFDQSQFDIDGLRKCLVNDSCRMSYDYNSDHKVDILDLLATKDLSRTVLSTESDGTGHGFEQINYHGTTTTKSTKKIN